MFLAKISDYQRKQNAISAMFDWLIQHEHENEMKIDLVNVNMRRQPLTGVLVSTYMLLL